MGILNKVQKEQKVWAKENFGESGYSNKIHGNEELLLLISTFGKLCRTHLKESQGIRGTSHGHRDDAIRYISELKNMLTDYYMARFESKNDYGPKEGTDSIFGLAEEVGELASAHIESNEEKIVDSVGDIEIYLADYCNKKEINLEKTTDETWRQVKQRNWNKNKENGNI